jgi:hypothetical protein
MAITYVNSAKFPTSFPAATNNISSITIAKPTNTAQNDVMVAFIATVSAANMTTVPSGWTLVDSNDNGSNLKVWVYRKIAGASEGASYNWQDDSGAIGPMCGLISSWRGCDVSGNPIDSFNSAVTTTADPVTTPSITTASGIPIHCVFTRTTNVASQGTFTEASGMTERMNPANRGGAVQYSAELHSSTAVTHWTTIGASQAGVAFDYSGTPTNAIQYQVGLKASFTAATATPTDVSAAIVANDASTVVTSNSATTAAAAATAYDATVLTGIAASATSAGASVTAFDAQGWVIFPAYAGVSAYDASVAIRTDAEAAQATVSVGTGVGYFGAPASRRWRIEADDRTWRIPAEDRTWRIPSSD